MAQATEEQARYDFRTLPSPKRVRARIGGSFVLDTTRARLFIQGHPRAYMVPREDLREDLVTDHGGTKTDGTLGRVRDAAFTVDGRTVEDAARYLEEDPDRPGALADAEGYVLVPWSKMDAWYEEDEEVYTHPRDPYHRIDVLQSTRHVIVQKDGETVAESRRPVMLFETGLPPRYYLPQTDVRLDLLVASDKTTACPYKGTATYHHVETSEGSHDDLVWCYRAPFAEVYKIQGLLAFFDERVDLTVDGKEQERPRTMWSRD